LGTKVQPRKPSIQLSCVTWTKITLQFGCVFVPALHRTRRTKARRHRSRAASVPATASDTPAVVAAAAAAAAAVVETTWTVSD